MVGAGEQKLCAAGDGAKFSDHKFIVVDRIVVQHIVFLKLSRVVDKIVVDGKVSDADVRIVDNKQRAPLLNKRTKLWLPTFLPGGQPAEQKTHR